MRHFLLPLVLASTVFAASHTSQTSAAISSTSVPATATPTSLTGLIAAVPVCALSCLALVSVNLGCASTDLTCVCRSSVDASASLAAQLGACLLQAGCNGTDLNAVQSLAPGICAQASTAASSVLSMVSTEIAGELAEVTATATASGAKTASTTSAAKTTATPAAGAAPPAGTRATMALLGIGGVAVLAAYAL
ncbi:hypothetical protein SEUCBS139899_002470 [Sporothrix eucalyptigena]|uniref:CFEM domain-containing protein n=1 Tax=Sporothrix eucalyptigena TaxID=1812306 RepID=A0ABP0B434_9PEZI